MNKSFLYLKKILQHELISGSFYVFIGFIISSAISFIFNLFLARNLPYSSYGEYASLLSLFTLATIPAGSLSAVIVKFAAVYFANNEEDKASYLYKKMFLFWGFASFLIFLIFVAFASPLSSFLKISDLFLIVLLGLSVGFSYFAVVNTAFLQSLTRFGTLSSLTIFGALGKLALGFLLISEGLKVLGAMLSITFLTIINFTIPIFPLRKLMFYKHERKVDLHTNELISYGIPTSMALLFLSSFISIDVILVKHFFPMAQAGYYGGLSLIGKVIFYFTAPIPLVMFPLLVKRHARGEEFKNLLYISLVLILIPSILITVFYFIFPDLTVKIFLGGGEYEKVSKYLGWFGIFLTIFSTVNVLVNFFLSLRKTFVVYLVILGSLLQILLIWINHQDFLEIIYASIASSLFLLVILLVYYVKEYGFHNSSK